MLDFYLLADIQPIPNQVPKLEYIGELEEDAFFQLQEGGVIEPWFDYYGSFRWGSENVARILLKLQQQPVAILRQEKTELL